MDFTDEELAQINVIKDKRRRYVYAIADTQTGHQLSEKNLKIVSFYRNRHLFLLVIALLAFYLLSNITLVALGWLILDGGSMLIFDKVFLPKLPTLKIRDEDYEKLTSPTAIKLREKDRLIFGVMTLLSGVLILLSFIDGRYKILFTGELYIAYLIVALLFAYAVYSLMLYFKNRKLWKAHA